MPRAESTVTSAAANAQEAAMPQRSIHAVIQNQHPVVASAAISVAEAARVMKQNRIGALLVVEGERLAGIFTERDVLFRVVAEGRDARTTHVAEVMTANPRTISPDRPFAHALHMMYEGEFRHVPVVEDGRPLGMVSARDALEPDLRQFITELETRAHIGEVLG
jgi:CBS domain-containing protein